MNRPTSRRSVFALACLISATCGFGYAQACDSLAAKINAAKQSIERDKNAIRSLGFNADADEFESWAAASAKQREIMTKTAYDNLIAAALGTIGESAQNAVAPQGNLPNGYASLNPFNVNTYVNRLHNPNGAVALLLRDIAATSDKKAKLNFLKQLVDAASKEKDSYDLLVDDPSHGPDLFERYVGLTEVLADLAGFRTASATLQIGKSGANTIVAYANLAYGNLALKQLNRLTVSKAKALATLDSKLKADVGSLRLAQEQFTQCQTSPKKKGDFQCEHERMRCMGGCESESIEDTNICGAECNIANDGCMHRPTPHSDLVWLEKAKALRACAKQLSACQHPCSSIQDLYAEIGCLDGCAKASHACLEAAGNIK